MTVQRVIFTTLLVFFCGGVQAQAPVVGSPLPPLAIAELGELLLESDEFSYRPWSTEYQPGTVQIVQYFGGTKQDSEIFEPFTDQLQERFELGDYHMTTIINLDEALWGTTGFLISQLKKNKRKFPGASMVLDEDGIGVSRWQLGEEGAGVVILDAKGIVQYFTRGAMSAAEISASIELVRSYVKD